MDHLLDLTSTLLGSNGNSDNNSTLTASAFFLVASAAALIVVKTTTSNKKKKNPWPSVKGCFPLVGNALTIQDTDQLYHYFQTWAKDYGSEHGVFEFELLLGKKVTAICAEDAILEVMKHRLDEGVVRSPNARSIANGIGAVGVFSAMGEQWRHDRKLVGTALNRQHVRDYYLAKFKRVAKRMMNKWETLIMEGKASNGIPVAEDLGNTAMDNLAVTIFGQDPNSVGKEYNDDNDKDKNKDNITNTDDYAVFTETEQLIEDIRDIMDVALFRVFSPFRYWDIPVIGPYLDRGGRIANRIDKSVQRIVQDCEEKLQREPSSKNNTKNKTDETLLARLLTLNRESDNLISRQRVVGQLVTLFFAGTDSSAAALRTAVWKLAAASDEFKEAAAKEVLALPGAGVDDVPDMDVLTEKLPTLRAFVMEMLRVHGPFPCIFLAAGNRDLEFRGGVIEKNTDILILSRAAMVNQSQPPASVPKGPNGEPAHEFCSQRWLVPNDNRGNANSPAVKVQLPSVSQTGAHLHFGHGVRMCPGKDFAEHELMLPLAYALERFQVLRLQPGHEPIHKVAHFSEDVNCEIRLDLQKRSRQ